LGELRGDGNGRESGQEVAAVECEHAGNSTLG
jgi:hypothetical protein